MTPLWLALLPADPGDAAVARAEDRNGEPVGVLCMWWTRARPHHKALRADPRIHADDGPPCVVSLAMAPATARPIADDPAVVHARRAALRFGRTCAVSLLTADPVSIAGALSIARANRPDEVAALRDDPFAQLWGARRLSIAAGLLGAVVRPTGPSLERYSGQPWPYDRFDLEEESATRASGAVMPV